jgi:hypothetical protein
MTTITPDEELQEAARLRARERFQEARNEVYRMTADIPLEEVDALVDRAVKESRRKQAGVDKRHT